MAIVRVHHPTITNEKQWEQIKKATQEFYKEVKRSEKEIQKSKKN